jgi:heme O synthase-like polyprenyltransferase
LGRMQHLLLRRARNRGHQFKRDALVQRRVSRLEPSYAFLGRAAFRAEIHLLVIAFASLVMIGYAAVTGDKLVAAIGALLFAQRLIFTGWRATSGRPIVATANDDRLPPLRVLQSTTRLTAWTMLWASAAFVIAYPLLGLRWQHGWQYGAGAGLLALGLFYYALRLHTPADSVANPAAVEAARRLSMAFAVAVAGAIGWLIFSGKLATVKNDWLANDIFLGSAAAILALSVMCIIRARPDPLNR